MHIITIKTRCTHPDFGTEFGNTGGPLSPIDCCAASYEKTGWNRVGKKNSWMYNALPGKTQREEGQPSANSWIHENTHFLGEDIAQAGSAPGGQLFRRNTHQLEAHDGKSAPGEQLATREHAPAGSTRCGEGQSVMNNWLCENTHFLGAHDAGRVSPW